MNWYRQSAIETFNDRNDLNKRIRDFQKIVKTLKYVAKHLYMNAPAAKNIINRIKKNKKMSSFPDIIDLLNTIEDKILDNRHVAFEFCHRVIKKLQDKIDDMIEERDDFVPQRKGDDSNLPRGKPRGF
ncbi:MAG: hypothetical protein ACOC5T_08425 [Elusimicrobiota bacterium]